MNYQELVTAVKDYLETDEPTFVANIPLFVKAVENRIYSEVWLPPLRKTVQGSLLAHDRHLTVPNDYIAAHAVSLIDPDTKESYHLVIKDANLIREVYPSAAYLGVPKYYGILKPYVLLIGPTPAKNYDVELHYFHYPESIVTAGTSWVAENFHSVLLYGVIAEGYRFLKGDPAQQKIYDDQYTASLALLAKQGEARTQTETYKPPR